MATERHKHLRDIGSLMTGAYHTYFMARMMLLDNLSENQRRAWDYIWCMKNDTRMVFGSSTFVNAFGWQQNYASDVLRELTEFGLLKRREVVDANGKFYTYEIAQR